jgi:hypothetical protein
MNRDRFRSTGSNTFLTGASPQSGSIDFQRYFSAPRPSGFDLGSGGGGVATVNLRPYRLRGVEDNALLVESITFGAGGAITGSGTQVWAAKPPWFRRSTWDGKTINSVQFSILTIDPDTGLIPQAGTLRRAIVPGTVNQIEEVSPPYHEFTANFQGDIIYCLAGVSENIGVEVSGQPVTLIALDHGREWAVRSVTYNV